jgi:hypothetical protein
MVETRNPWFIAVEARTQEEADQHFDALLEELRSADPEGYRDEGKAKESVVANLMYVCGYYGPDVQERAGRFYSHKSPYRRGG